MFIFNNSQRDLSNFLSQMFGQNNVNYVIVQKDYDDCKDELTRLYTTKNKILKNDLIEKLNKREKLYYEFQKQIKVNSEEENKEKTLNELKEENRFMLKYFIDWQEVDKETYEKVKNWDMTNHSFEEVKKTARFFIWDKEYSEKEFFEVLKKKKK